MTFGRSIARRRVYVALTLLTVAAPVAAATPHLTGTLQTDRAILVGTTSVPSAPWSTLVVHGDAPDIDVAGSWALSAREVTVHWFRRSWVGVGSAPNDPDASLLDVEHPDRDQGDRPYQDSKLTGIYRHRETSLLVLARDTTSAIQGRAEPLVQIRASPGETWVSGYFGPSSTAAGAHPRNDLSAGVDVSPGAPILETESASHWRMTGNFSMYVWFANITVTGSDGARDGYPTGLSYSNVTTLPAGGAAVTRQATARFVRIDATQATLTLAHGQGTLGLSHATIPATVYGTCRFEEATGRLVATDALYDVENEPVEVAGTTRLFVEGSGEAASILGRIESDGAPTNLSAFWTRSPPGMPVWVLAMWMFSLAALLAAAGVTSYYVWPGFLARYKRPLEMYKARDELTRNRPRTAARRLRRVLRFHPQDGVAWFLYVAARCDLDGPTAVARRVERVWSNIVPRLPVALTLATEFLRYRDETRARSWYERALQEPGATAVLASDPELRQLTERLRPRRAPHYSYG